mmetsp:Transcript_25459/g.29367  ORF Transcript_25459/g.29367 Transcript_25459/m.29367 type:complete len:94 (-) Transcript_25459:1114-1395(-)
MVLFEAEHIENVGVPRFYINGKGAGALPASLVHVSASHIKDSQHGHETIAHTTCSFNIGPTGAYFVHAEAYPTSALANDGAAAQCLIDAYDGI